MTEETPENYSEPDKAKWSFVGFIVGVIVTVLALKHYGYLVFPTEEGRATIAEFRLMSLSTEHDVKVSVKSSGKEAFCDSGYLLLRPQNGKDVAGILVDEKNRAIVCRMSPAAPEE